MSKLEKEVIPIIRHSLAGTGLLGTVLTAENCFVLARWAFKTAIVRNLGTNYRRLVPVQHYTTLHDSRSIPESTFVDLALCPAHRGLGAVQSQSAVGIVTRGDEQLVANRQADVYNISLAVGPMLFRVVHLPFPGYEVKATLAHGRRALRLWPGPIGGTLAQENLVADLYDLETSTFFDEVSSGGNG